MRISAAATRRTAQRVATRVATAASPAPPGLSPSAPAQDFGSVFQGTTQSAKITVTNTSSAAMAHAPLVLLEGGGDEVAIDSRCAHPLAPSESCDIEVTYSPRGLTA